MGNDDATMIWRGSIYPLHEVRSESKLETLRAAMECDGWTGRPLLVVLLAGAHRALTGSHRIVAAKLAGLDEIPCLVLDADEMGGDLAEAILAAADQDDCLALLRGAGLMDAAALLSEEECEVE